MYADDVSPIASSVPLLPFLIPHVRNNRRGTRGHICHAFDAAITHPSLQTCKCRMCLGRIEVNPREKQQGGKVTGGVIRSLVNEERWNLECKAHRPLHYKPASGLG